MLIACILLAKIHLKEKGGVSNMLLVQACQQELIGKIVVGQAIEATEIPFLKCQQPPQVRLNYLLWYCNGQVHVTK